MADEALSNAGLYLDELNKIRLLDPESAQQTGELKDECKDFVEKILEFQKIVKYFTEKFDEISKLVEKEKMKAIGSRNAAKSMQKQIEGQVMQLKALYVERKMELERLSHQYDSLVKKESEQLEFIQQFTSHNY
ncbi:unnamed protein product [Brachionus calyciflorus]|uniref:Intraflagellar transport 20 n=1 Tax=Brachionus calyciflorus TaxID=104777 RepID=A0A813M0W0_9BILA|nr:unnamed protein product [Brachionus calyciflorus]